MTLSFISTDQPTDVFVVNAERIVWGGTTCAGAAISYRVEITRLNDTQPIDVIMTDFNEAVLPVPNLVPNQDYTISVTAVGSTCSSDPAVTSFKLIAGKYQLVTTTYKSDKLLSLATQSADQALAGGVGGGLAALAIISVMVIVVIIMIVLAIRFHSKAKCSGQLQVEAHLYLDDQHELSCYVTHF